MVLKIISLICVTLFFFALGVFEVFVISHLREIKAKVDNMYDHHWNMDVYMNDIPQTEQNTPRLSSVPLKLYKSDECLGCPIPREGEEINGVYYSDENIFVLSGIVDTVSYNIHKNRVIVECKCTDICKI